MQKKWSRKYHNLCNNLSNFINQKNFFILLVFFTIVKIIFSNFFGDKILVDEWFIIINNLNNHQTLGYHTINDRVIPSVYMPPLYIYIIYFFNLTNFSEFISVKIILFLQCIVSGISIYYFFKILKLYFSEKISLLISLAYFFYPLNFYSSSQISSVSFQVSFFIFFIYFYLAAKTQKQFFLLGVFSGLMTLIRGEFWLLLVLLFFLKFFKKSISFKNFIITLVTLTIIISPTLIRNFITFEQIVLTKSSGYNLWRGNSKTFNVNGEKEDTGSILEFKKNLKKELFKKNETHKYEIIADNYYFEIALKNILKDPSEYFLHYIKKLFSFAVFNPFSNYPNYFHPLVFIPEILISCIALTGIIKNIFSKYRSYEFLLITLYYLFIIPIFFVLPRYKLFILPLYFIFISYFFAFLSKRIFSKKQ